MDERVEEGVADAAGAAEAVAVSGDAGRDCEAFGAEHDRVATTTLTTTTHRSARKITTQA